MPGSLSLFQRPERAWFFEASTLRGRSCWQRPTLALNPWLMAPGWTPTPHKPHMVPLILEVSCPCSHVDKDQPLLLTRSTHMDQAFASPSGDLSEQTRFRPAGGSSHITGL